MYWGELDSELEGGGSWGRGVAQKGPPLSLSPCAPKPSSPAFSSSVFSLKL